MEKNLGHATAYGYAKSKGYTGTEEEYAELMASYATVAEQAEESAESASQSATQAGASATSASQSATTATTKASEASQSAQTATTKASEASASADTATTKASEASASATTASSKASEASASATSAQTAQTAAEGSAITAQTAAQTATQKAAEAAESARTLTIDTTLSQSGQAADSKAVGDEIDVFKTNVGRNVPSVNLIDNSKVIANSICNSTNLVISTNDIYDLYKVKVEGGQTYTYKQGGRVASAKPRYIVFVDANGAGISVIDRTNMESPAFETPQTAVEAWITVNNNDIHPTLLLGSYPSAYEQIDYIPYGDTYESALTTADLNNYKKPRKNLVDETKTVNGFLDAVNVISPNSGYETTDYIPVKANTLYSIGPAGGGARYVCLYDEKKVGYSRTSESRVYSFTPDVDGYCRLTYYIANKGQYILVEGTDISYEAYKEVYAEDILLNDAQINDVKSQLTIGNILAGKKWAVLGDSFTAGATNTVIADGRYKGEHYVYPYLIGNRNNMDIVSFFGGGRTLAFPANPDTFVNSVTCPSQSFYYQNIPSDVDYITIYLGINDSHHENGGGGDGEDTTGIIPLGTLSDADTSTYYGAWNVVLTWLITNRPFAHIGMVISNGCDREAYRTAQLEIAKKYGVPYIDLNGDARTPAMIRSQNPDIASAVKSAIAIKQAVDYSGGNLHPNDAAHEYESLFIENFLRSI